jgi:hypothetical protein
MLARPDGAPFTTSRAGYLDQALGQPEVSQKIIVKITAESLPGAILAQVDTGAAWSMLDVEIADALSLLSGSGEPVRISTRHGDFDGRLERTSLELLADEGDSLTIEATVWVSPDWRSGNFLGYGGLLERLRFAVDPIENSFHFGRAE